MKNTKLLLFLATFAWSAILGISYFGGGCSETGPTTVKPEPKDTASLEWYCSTMIDSFPNNPAAMQQPAVGIRGKAWPVGATLKIGFIGGTTQQKDLAKAAFAEWKKYVNLNFTYPTAGPYEIRVAFQSGGGAWSYLGKDCASVPQSSPTMNLGFNQPGTYLHEIGHALSLGHEQSSPFRTFHFDEPVVIAELQGSPNFWTLAQIQWNVFHKYTELEADATPFDPISVMEYYIKAAWTQEKIAIPGGSVLSPKDKTFASYLYPGTIPPTTGITLTSEQVQTAVTTLNQALAEVDTARARVSRANAKVKKILGQ